MKHRLGGSICFRCGGFTLVEVIIIVGIIGILSVIAIPNFLAWQAKAKQSEARTTLNAIYIAEFLYFSESDAYTDDFSVLGWDAADSARYSYDLGGNVIGKTKGSIATGKKKKKKLSSQSQCKKPKGKTSTQAYTAEACGNIDADDTIDQWHMYQDQTVRHVVDDASF